jgi:uncharacterized protein (DUF433 family)
MEDDEKLLARIVVRPDVFGGKPIIRGRRMAVEHILGMLAAGDAPETLLEGYPWLEPEDIRACLLYAYLRVAGERVEPLILETSS